ncbi:MAG: hypothetical protein ACRD47_03425 [Nitrososphaeraceae archaeon]|jgi:hypothetical protein
MRRSTYMLVIDVLGYEKLAEEISSTTGLKTSHIRRSFFLEPLDLALRKFQNNINYRRLTDNFLVFVYELKIIFEIISSKLTKATLSMS